MSPKEMIGFRLYTDKLLYDTYNSEMWCAGYIMNEGCSDDSFEYFRNWVISRGKDTYLKAKENPDYLINEVVDGAEFYDFEIVFIQQVFKLRNLHNELVVFCFGAKPHNRFNYRAVVPAAVKKYNFTRIW